ncbi:DUF1287 domain-containing protein [Microbulbifer aggregans]|uniref:DUF1287 domain-containing protein n=1 Tax=Microbulbifer aggregans TaxID=1769779 RepID=UPI001CFEB990|nr:DUF1287 domain-containing protein [Microbulbifer aggregans]
MNSLSMAGLFLFCFIFCSQVLAGPSFEERLVTAAVERTKQNVTYDGSYFSIGYPNGDVPGNIGVCTDVVIRSYRALGTDLQVLVHEDMAESFSAYPSNRIWGLTGTDRNIDHRRVPNLQIFFARHGEVLPNGSTADGYGAGDIVTWMLPGNLPHIGIVTNRISPVSGNPLIVHNIGAGPVLDDMLFSYEITGHYRFVPKEWE